MSEKICLFMISWKICKYSCQGQIFLSSANLLVRGKSSCQGQIFLSSANLLVKGKSSCQGQIFLSKWWKLFFDSLIVENILFKWDSCLICYFFIWTDLFIRISLPSLHLFSIFFFGGGGKLDKPYFWYSLPKIVF